MIKVALLLFAEARCTVPLRPSQSQAAKSGWNQCAFEHVERKSIRQQQQQSILNLCQSLLLSSIMDGLETLVIIINLVWLSMHICDGVTIRNVYTRYNVCVCVAVPALVHID